MVLVSVMVVVTGLRIVVSCDVVVVLRVDVPSLAQPVSDNRAATARHGRMNFIIGIIVVWFLNLTCKITPLVGCMAMGCNPTPYPSVRMDWHS